MAYKRHQNNRKSGRALRALQNAAVSFLAISSTSTYQTLRISHSQSFIDNNQYSRHGPYWDLVTELNYIGLTVWKCSVRIIQWLRNPVGVCACFFFFVFFFFLVFFFWGGGVYCFVVLFFTCGRGQNVAAIALDRRLLGTIIAIFKMWLCPFNQPCIRHPMTKLK